MKNNSKENFTTKVKELDSLIAYFENVGTEFNLDEGIKKYEEAITIVKELKNSLKSYELKIKELDIKYQEDSEVE